MNHRDFLKAIGYTVAADSVQPGGSVAGLDNEVGAKDMPEQLYFSNNGASVVIFKNGEPLTYGLSSAWDWSTAVSCDVPARYLRLIKGDVK